MPPSCKNAFQATPNGHNAWHWLKVKKVSIACSSLETNIANRKFHSQVNHVGNVLTLTVH